MSVAVKLTAQPRVTFQPGVPQPLFPLPRAWFSEADAASDGNRFMVAVPVDQKAPQAFTVVLNWQAELAVK
jgi:hypothetical protein